MTEIDDILTDPATSYWLKRAIAESLNRDPVDAARDARILAELLEGGLIGYCDKKKVSRIKAGKQPSS